MNVIEAIRKRRAYRSLKKVEINKDIINDLTEAVSLCPSCYNNQPWRFVFVYDKSILENLYESFSKTNVWASKSSMVAAIFTKKELDCPIPERNLAFFDTGMATAYLILRATELGLVAHPIAGFDSNKVQTILNIPEDFTIIALLVIGEKNENLNEILTDHQKEVESNRPPRLKPEKFVSYNKFTQ